MKFEITQRLIENDSSIPILSSIGKQTKGKSFFLSKFLQDNLIPNKHGQFVDKGTNEVFSRLYQNFLLFDVEGFENQKSPIQRDIFSFASILSISDIILLHISQEDMQNQRFISSFSYICFQALRIQKNYRKDLPEIILLIRDPTWDFARIETFQKYQELFAEFNNAINREISQYNQEFVKVFIDLTKNSINEEAKLHQELRSMQGRGSITFPINRFEVIFSVKLGIGMEYVYKELVNLGDNAVDFIDSNYRDLYDHIINISNEKRTFYLNRFNPIFQKLFDIESEFVLRIQRKQLSEAIKELSKDKIVLNIYHDVKGDILLQRDNLDGYLTILKKYQSISTKLEPLDKFISNGINKNKDKKKLKLEHKTKFQKILIGEFKDDQSDMRAQIISYMRYLSAKTFCEVLSLVAVLPDSVSYQTLNCIMDSPQDLIAHQLKQLEKSIDIFKCSCYYDNEYLEVLKDIFPMRFFIFEQLYLCYEKIIIDSLDQDYLCEKILNHIIQSFKKKDYIHNLNQFLNLVSEFVTCNINEIIEFIHDLKNLHKILLVTKKKEYLLFPERFQFEYAERKMILYSFTLLERLIPSATSLIIGIGSSLLRTGLIRSAAGAIAATASTAWIPIVGWTIFGVTVAGSIGWGLYSYFKGDDEATCKYEFNVPRNKKIYNVFINKKLTNGTLPLDREEKAEMKYKYTATLRHPRNAKNSASFLVQFTIILIDEDVQLDELFAATFREIDEAYQTN